ncbi:unnamed protein product [Penicillium manginii]
MADNQSGGERAGGRRKNRDMGRKEFGDRSERQAENKRRKIENGEEVIAPIYATQFSKEEIANEERRPKKKVAILMGYSGTGYFGMQLNENQKTIEGDLFAALVAAGAISKANAEDPKKSSFVRCARTDKGVHAAGNVVSLKMIIEDPDIVEKINEKLGPQIRVWGVEPTTSGFNCYQLVDSRVYEYLMPSYCLLPPHPSTYLGQKTVELAEKHGLMDDFKSRQEEVAGWWEEVDKTYIKPILDNVPEDVRAIVQKSLFWYDAEQAAAQDAEGEGEGEGETEATPEAKDESPKQPSEPAEKKPFKMTPQQQMVTDTVKAIKAAYIQAKKAYRVPSSRVTRLQECLTQYEGTQNFHNYTVQKTHKDPSAKRHIKSFKVNPEPIVINGTEWLSLKVHGQSFMMHQIRKMVAMCALVVRSGCTPDRIKDTYGPDRIAIPKAPGLGLLLERPIFDNYNSKAKTLDRDPIDFEKYATAMNEFKQREIYDRIFREEEDTTQFGSFFNHIDHFPQEHFLYTTAGGIAAAKLATAPTDNSEKPKAASGGKKVNDQKDALAAVEGAEEETAPPPKEGN